MPEVSMQNRNQTSLAIDLGGSRIKIGFLVGDKVVKFSMIEIPYGCTLTSSLTKILDRVGTLLTREERGTLSGIGFAFPGLVDFNKKRVIAANGKYVDACKINLEQWVKDNFNCFYCIENDANAALLGELQFGCGNNSENAVMMILGTGVGTAAVMEGRLVRGKHYQAGCLGGHFPIELDGRRCSCQGKGCVEANASTWALPALVKEHPLYKESLLCKEKIINFQILKEYIEQGDKVAIEVLDYCIKSWSNGLIALIYAYDPEFVIFSGGVFDMGNVLLKPMIDNVKKNIWTPWGELSFKVAENREHSVLLGLHYLVEQSLN